MKLDYFRLVHGKLCIIITLSLISFFLSTLQTVRAFELQVNLYDAKTDSGKIDLSVSSQETGKEKSRTLDVGKIVAKTEASTVEGIFFNFPEKDLPPNGAFKVCAFSLSLGLKNCEQGDRHYDSQSAIMWVQVPQ